MAALPPQQFTIFDAIIECGIPIIPLFQGLNPAQRVAEEIFNNSFEMCIEKSPKDLKDDFETFSNLPANAGRIRFVPSQKRALQALIQWTKEKYMLGQDPTQELFPAAQATIYITRQKEISRFVEQTSSNADLAKPETFSTKVKWADWMPTFKNFLRNCHSIRGIPLSYVIRDNEEAVAVYDPNLNILDNFVLMAPLQGRDYDADKAQVHTLIQRFITGNDMAESKIQSHDDQGNGRRDFIALREHYEGVGFHAKEITRAEHVIKNFHYNGERRDRNMTWDKFEKDLNHAFAVVDRNEGHEVYSDTRKLRLLLDKVRSCDFLRDTISSINVSLAAVPMTMTYNQAITAFRNVVNAKFPPGSNTNNYRRVQQNNRRNSTHGRKRSGENSKHRDATKVRMKDGSTRMIHASMRLTADDWKNLPDDVALKIKNARNEYNQRSNKKPRYQLSESNTSSGDNATTVSAITTDSTGAQFVSVPLAQYIQQTNAVAAQQSAASAAGNTHATIPNSVVMGGRAEQIQLKSRNANK